MPWCSSFVNWCFEKSGFKGTRSAAARSWLRWGQELEVPKFGCVVVLKRGNSATAGHVGFWMGESHGGRLVIVLGGNQKNRVNISLFRSGNVIGYRWPIGYPLQY